MSIPFDPIELRKRAIFGGSPELGGNRPSPDLSGRTPIPTPEEMMAPQFEELFPTGDISQLRMQNVMSAPSSPDERSLMDIINESYTPETQDTERFRNLLDSFPERGEPSFMDKLAGAGAYLGNVRRNIPGGQKAAEAAKYAGFNREMEDWKEKTTPTYQLANLERFASNANERQLAGQIGTAEYNQRKLDEQQRATDIKAEIAKNNLDLQRLKYNNPDLKFDYSGVMVKVADPRSGKITVTNIPTDKVDEATRLATSVERAEIMAAGALERANIAAQTRGKVPVQMPDPKDPTKTITGTLDLATNIVTPTTVGTEQGVTPAPGGGVTAPVTKLGTSSKLTQPTNLASIQAMTQEVLTLIDNEVLDSTGKEPKLNPKIEAGLGWSAWDPRQYLPESEQRAATRTFGRLKDVLTLELIGEMKAQSKTGATGFGQLTGRELDVLESAASKLDPALDKATLIAELKRIREKLQKVMLPADGLNPTVAPTPNKPVAGPPQTGNGQTIIQRSPSTGQYRISKDGGATWAPYAGSK